MGFETLSSAIVHVIINYHAYRTEAPLIDTTVDTANANASLEHILDCTTDEIDHVIKKKITEATTDNNSCRLTLLQYMHFGLSISEKARKLEDNPDEQEALKTQLVEFILNLQRLFVFTATNLFITDKLVISLDKEQSLLIFKLNSPAAQAYKLTQTLFSTIKLSPENTKSTEAEIQRYVSDLFLFKNNHALSQENIAIEESIQAITQYMNTLECQIAPLSITNTTPALKSTPPTQSTLEPTDQPHHPHDAHLTKGWELITLGSSQLSQAEVENKQLIAQHQELTKAYEEKQQHCIILESTLTTLKNKPKSKPEPQFNSVYQPSELTTREVYLGLSRRKITQKAVVTEQPMHREISEPTEKNTLRSFLGSSKPNRFSLFGLLAKSLDLTHGFSDSASSDSSSSESSSCKSGLT